jgi:hypothetical protein
VFLCLTIVLWWLPWLTYATDSATSTVCASNLLRQTTKWLAYGCHTSVLLFDWCIPFLVLFQLCDVPQTLNIQQSFNNRILRWAGHVARMPMTRAPRQLLTGWVAHSRPNGCPEMTWGRTLKKALKCKGLPANFKEWRAIAEDRSEWRKDEHCITQKDTQPSQTCSGGFINT